METSGNEIGRAVTHYEEGRRLAVQSDLLEAAREFREAMDADPEFLDARFELARLHRRMGLFEECADALKRCVAELPHDSEVLREAADVAALTGESEKALALYEAALGIDATDEAAASNGIAIAWVHEGPKKAMKRLRACLENHPGWAEGFQYLGSLHEMDGKDVEAEEAYQRALDLAPDSPEASERLVRLRSGDPPEVCPLQEVYEKIRAAELDRLRSEGFAERAEEWERKWKEH